MAVRVGSAAMGLCIGIPRMIVGITRAKALPKPEPAERRPESFSVDLSVKGQPLRLLGLATGTVTIKNKHKGCTCSDDRNYPARFADILNDSGFAEPMPVYTYVLVHSDGTHIAVDTGTDPTYYEDASWEPCKRDQSVVHSIIVLDMKPEESMERQLKSHGMDPKAFASVVLTHMHIDHTGGVPMFGSEVPIWTSLVEVQSASMIGACMGRWSNSASFRYIEESTEEFAPLVQDGKIKVYHTPGHTPGSLSVCVESDQGRVWLCGDSTFDLAGLEASARLAGIHFQPPLVRREHERLRQEVEQGALILPSHDWTAAERARAFAFK